jgi:hypothetical protein
MDKVSLSSGLSQNGRTISKKAMIASKTSSDPALLAQPNIVVPFLHYDMKIRMCHRSGLLAF